jgi:hypothetical protein
LDGPSVPFAVDTSASGVVASSSRAPPGTEVVVVVELVPLVVVVAVDAGGGGDAVETVTPSVPQEVRTSASSTNRAANVDVRNERVMGDGVPFPPWMGTRAGVLQNGYDLASGTGR